MYIYIHIHIQKYTHRDTSPWPRSSPSTRSRRYEQASICLSNRETLDVSRKEDHFGFGFGLSRTNRPPPPISRANPDISRYEWQCYCEHLYPNESSHIRQGITPLNICVCVYVYMYICICIYMLHMYIFIYIDIQIYIQMQICTYKGIPPPLDLVYRSSRMALHDGLPNGQPISSPHLAILFLLSFAVMLLHIPRILIDPPPPPRLTRDMCTCRYIYVYIHI